MTDIDWTKANEVDDKYQAAIVAERAAEKALEEARAHRDKVSDELSAAIRTAREGADQ